MVTLSIKENYANKKLSYILGREFPGLPFSTIQKAFKNKDFKINGIRTNKDINVNAGDVIEIYIKDELLKKKDSRFLLDIIYEDDNIMIVNKPQGISVIPDFEGSNSSLIGLVKEYLQGKGENDSECELCHRLDRNTGGLIIITKNKASYDFMYKKIKNHEVRKFYKCTVVGCPTKKQAELKHYLFKDSKKSMVYIYDTKRTGCVEIITKYKVLGSGQDTSTLEVELVTGKTHQIRAHLAHIGHPIIGDGKYGINEINKKFKAKHQQLWAYKLIFDFKETGILDYLKGKTFKIDL